MELKTLEELKQEADALGLIYHPKIGAEKLSKQIENYYKSQAAEDSVKSIDDVEDTTIVDQEDSTPKKPLQGPVGTLSKEAAKRKRISDAKAAAFKKRIVTISSNDKRDSEYVTTAYLSMENQYFGIARIVPLDIPVELEQCLIDVAKMTEITLHKDEVVDGKRTNNKVPTRVRKYNISYEDIK